MSLTRVPGIMATWLSKLTGAIRRSLNDKLEEIVSVKDFGAVGDGVTDDTSAIRAAINASLNKKAVVYIPAGTYLVTSVIQVPLGDTTDLHIRGDGDHLTNIKLLSSDPSFLNVTGNDGNWWTDSGTPHGSFQMSDMTLSCWSSVAKVGVALSFSMGSIEGRPNKGIRLRNLVLKCEGGYWEYAVLLHNVHQVSVESCVFYSQSNVKDGIGIYGSCDVGKDGGGLHITDSEFYFYNYGVYTSDRFEGTYVTSCAFVNCVYGLLAVETGSESGVLVTNSEFDCWEQGIHLDGMFDAVITGNCFLFPPNTVEQRAITVNRGSGITITGNKIAGSNSASGTGIFLSNTDDALGRSMYVGGNAISGWPVGMYMQSCSNITFGPWSWRNCTLDTAVAGSNTYIQQGAYEYNTTLTQSLGAATVTWTVSIDISGMRLTRTPQFADLVSQTADNMLARYNYSASSATTVVFNVTLGNLGQITAGTYRFGLSVRTPYFPI